MFCRCAHLRVKPISHGEDGLVSSYRRLYKMAVRTYIMSSAFDICGDILFPSGTYCNDYGAEGPSPLGLARILCDAGKKFCLVRSRCCKLSISLDSWSLI